MMVSALLGAAGSLVSGMAAMQQANYQAAVAEVNAKQARINAKQEQEMSGRDQEDLGAQNRGLLGEQISAQAASGASLDSPSSQRARYRAREIAYQDIWRRAEEGNKRWANLRTQANVYDAEAGAHKQAGRMNMLGSLIGAASSVAGAFEGGGQTASGYQPTATKQIQPQFFSTGAPAATAERQPIGGGLTAPWAAQQKRRYAPYPLTGTVY